MAIIRLTGGGKIKAPEGARPSAVRVRKSLFDLLQHRFGITWEDKVILDGFAGAGTLGFEALQRDVSFALFIDREEAALTQIKKNATELRQEKKVKTLKRNMLKLGTCPATFPPADIVFLDPPYHKNLAPAALDNLAKGRWIKPDAFIVVETSAGEEIETTTMKLLSTHDVAKQRWHFLTPME